MLRDFILAAILVTLFAVATAHAQEDCTPIQFAPSQSSATVRGTARSMDTPISASCFTLSTRRGQTAMLGILLRSPKDDTAFTIPGVVDNQQKYTFKTEDKTYKILVYLTFARQPDRPFTMEVSVK